MSLKDYKSSVNLTV